MGQAVAAALVALLIFYSVVPLGCLIALVWGGTFFLRNVFLWALVTALLSAAAAVLSLRCPAALARPGRMATVLLLPMALLNGFCCLILSGWSTGVLLSMTACWICGAILLIRYRTHAALAIGTTVVLLIPLGFLSLFAYVFGSFGYNTVVQAVDSPYGTYQARVISSDQGALGGNTFVDIYTVHGGIDLYFLQISPKPQRVYNGAWGEAESLSVIWRDEHTLLINGTACSISE